MGIVSTRARRLSPLAVIGLLLAALVTPAVAHRQPLPLAVWGDFGASAARCQRAIGRAATQCVLGVWAARRACIEPQLAGQPCDTNATALAVRAARERPKDLVARQCSETDATSLQFLGTQEVISDITSICRQLEKALVSAAYGPGLLDDAVVPVDEPTRRCLLAGARGAEQIVRAAMREQTKPLDFIAAQPVAGESRTAHVARATDRVAGAGSRFALYLSDRCDTARFEPVYHRSIERFVADLGSRGACLAGGVYVQGATVCPPSACGNGMVEPGEECDDGNAADGDACRNDCLRNEPAP